ncbi:hypothetical protein HYX16_00285 [Candidatus Woesearchaeota archaeon]|nr:hypothetical protein [Candidatus Woesearchaeota archaeon]
MVIKKDVTKNIGVSIIEFENSLRKKYKVTKRIPKFSVAGTKFFRSKEEALKQFEEWL